MIKPTTLLFALLLCLPTVKLIAQTISFTAPDTVCVGNPVTVTNTSTGSNYYWQYCNRAVAIAPNIRSIGNPGNSLSYPVMSTVIKDGGNYYVFSVNHLNTGNTNGNLVRMDFGTSLLNTPTINNLGNFSGAIPYQAIGISVKKDGNNWYAFIVGGYTNGVAFARINFGTNIANQAPTAVSLGNIGGMAYPYEIFLFNENSNWYGYVTNSDNHTLTLLTFGNSLSNTPTGTNIGNIGNLNRPFSARFLKDGNNWYAYITNFGSSTLTLLSFGTSLLNTPTGTNLGNPSGLLSGPNDLLFYRNCDQFLAYAVNYTGNSLVKLNFANNNIAGPVTATSMGSPAPFNQPHDFSELNRIGDSLYSIVSNPGSNTMALFALGSCTSSENPSSTATNPPAVTYNTPGIYNINLSMDEGLPSQNCYYKQIVVVALPQPVISKTGNVLSTGTFTSYQWYKNGVTINGATQQNYTATRDGNYYVIVTDRHGCSNQSATSNVSSNSVNVISGLAITVAPNPVQNILSIQCPVKVNAALYSVDGKKIMVVSNAHELHTEQLSPGYYLLRLTDEQGQLIRVEKIVKE